MAGRGALVLLAALLAGGCGDDRVRPGPLDPGEEPTGLVPLTDLSSNRYLGQYQGGLYPGGANSIPTDHAAAGAQAAALIRPVDPQGTPAQAGRIVVLVVGGGPAAQVACDLAPAATCNPGTLLHRVAADPAIDHERVRFVNAARFNTTYQTWANAGSSYYGLLRNSVLPSLGLGPNQVQAAWVHLATTHPVATLPANEADAIAMVGWLPDVLRALKENFPNLHVAWVTSRVYGGYGELSAMKEPSAYETGFGVKWTVEAQARQVRTGEIVIEEAGDLAPGRAAPWITWGPYWWADGPRPRNDGLTWRREHFEQDGVSPSPEGEARMAALLLDHLKGSPFARCWLLAGATCS